jgi:hypothetical protein
VGLWRPGLEIEILGQLAVSPPGWISLRPKVPLWVPPTPVSVGKSFLFFALTCIVNR